MRLGERSLAGLDPARRLRLGIAHARQKPALFHGLSIGEHLALGLVAGRTREATARSRVLRVIPELAGRERHMAAGLGRGDARLLDIGRALMSAPAVLLLDEPSLDLDTGRVERLLTALRDEGFAVLLAERYPEPALMSASRACLILCGRIVAEGSANSLRNDNRLLPACIGELSGA
jgi:branched-chain amino acid transport system ATP-binding protein